jgi:hypothetical protein
VTEQKDGGEIFIRISGMEYRSCFDVGLGTAGIKSVHTVAYNPLLSNDSANNAHC